MPSGPETPRPYVALFAALERLALRDLAAATLTAMRIKLGLRPQRTSEDVADHQQIEAERVDEDQVEDRRKI